MQNIYKNIRPALGVRASSINAAKKGVERTIYVKRIFALIKGNDIKGIRLTVSEYVHKRGAFNIFSIVRVFSFFGIKFLHYFPAAYKKFNEKWARFQLMRRFDGGFK